MNWRKVHLSRYVMFGGIVSFGAGKRCSACCVIAATSKNPNEATDGTVCSVDTTGHRVPPHVAPLPQHALRTKQYS